jgi:hypothetical protein
MSKTSPHPTPEDWASVRKHFNESAFADTELTVLAQNAGLSWYFKGKDETPRKYLAIEFDELNSVPGLVGKKSRVKRLVDILQSTIAFDEPFAEMADAIKTDIDADANPNRILLRLGIDPDFPSGLLQFDATSKALLLEESLETLGHLLAYVDRHAAQIELPGDCKALLNCLVHRDEIGIARYLPFRVGGKGLHLAESIGLIARDIPEPMQYALLKRAGIDLKDAENAATEGMNADEFENRLAKASARIAVACNWFKDEAAELREKVGSKTDTERFFVPLNHPHRERVAAVLARMHFGVDPASGKRSVFDSILKAFHKS